MANMKPKRNKSNTPVTKATTALFVSSSTGVAKAGYSSGAFSPRHSFARSRGVAFAIGRLGVDIAEDVAPWGWATVPH